MLLILLLITFYNSFFQFINFLQLFHAYLELVSYGRFFVDLCNSISDANDRAEQILRIRAVSHGEYYIYALLAQASAHCH